MSLYREIFHSSEVAALFSEKNTLAQMLRVEAALAKAQAGAGIFPREAAKRIGSCCAIDAIDLEQLKQAVKLGGNAAIPLVQQLTQLVKNKDTEAAKYVHLGATSQDIVDTATVLQIRDYLGWAEDKLGLLEKLLFERTKQHRATFMAGRTLLQQARPIAFGLKTAAWLDSIGRSRDRMAAAKKRVLRLQLGGAAGSGNVYISKSVQKNLAGILGLKTAPPWHTQRDNIAEFAAVMGILAGSLGKIAKDIALLMQTEIGEVFEGAAEGKGGSSAMPHKRNPVTCAAILANTHRIPFLVASILAAMPQEHERSAGLWHSEWETLTDILQLSAGALERSIDLVEGLEVDAGRMLENLDLTRGLLYAENVVLALAPTMGKSAAHQLVEKACKMAVAQQKSLKAVLIDLKIDLPQAELNNLFKPENAIGLSFEIIDDILAKFKKR